MAGIREQFMTKVAAELPEDIAKDLEKGIYNWSIEQCDHLKVVRNWRNPRFVHLYKDKARSIMSNLDDTGYVGNQRLLARLMEKEFLPHELPYLKPENLFPERWAAILDAKMKKDMCVFEQKPESMTSEFKCLKCKKRDCIYQEIQMRSSDEPLEVFITCINCGNKWKL